MDETQFRQRIMPIHKRLFAYALSIIGDESDAADCLQEALARLWEHRSRMDHIDNIEAYAVTTVRNIAVNHVARNRFSHDLNRDNPPPIPDTQPGPEDNLEGREKLKTVVALLKTLPDNQRKVILLSAVSGLSNSQIREATGFSDDNVRVLLSRGRKKLRELFLKNK